MLVVAKAYNYSFQPKGYIVIEMSIFLCRVNSDPLTIRETAGIGRRGELASPL